MIYIYILQITKTIYGNSNFDIVTIGRFHFAYELMTSLMTVNIPLVNEYFSLVKGKMHQRKRVFSETSYDLTILFNCISQKY